MSRPTARTRAAEQPSESARAFKMVRADFYDFHSGTVHYEIGSTVEVPKPDTTTTLCSAGLHVCWRLEDCIGIFGRHQGEGRYIEVELDRADVLAEENGKVRVRRLVVLREITVEEIIGKDFPGRVKRLVAAEKHVRDERNAVAQVLANFPDALHRKLKPIPKGTKPKGPDWSGARKLLDLVWRHNREATGHSWQRLNASMHSALQLAIEAGMEFKPGDVREIVNEYRGGYWFGDGGAERFYATAARMNNLSACASLETFIGRPRYKWQGAIVAVGTDLHAEGERATVTSFADDGQSLVACSYDQRSSRKVKRRITVKWSTFDELEKKRRKATKKPAGDAGDDGEES